MSNIISSNGGRDSLPVHGDQRTAEKPLLSQRPLHDGAVVVRDGRIAAAACMLPMSERMNLSKELGMRHRAGIGMSERSDAVVAIVSEETGAISTVVNGNLRRHLSPETLGRILRNELLPREETNQNKRKHPLLFWKGRGSETVTSPKKNNEKSSTSFWPSFWPWVCGSMSSTWKTPPAPPPCGTFPSPSWGRRS